MGNDRIYIRKALVEILQKLCLEWVSVERMTSGIFDLWVQGKFPNMPDSGAVRKQAIQMHEEGILDEFREARRVWYRWKDSKVLLFCRECRGPIKPVGGTEGVGVRCLKCGNFEGHKDYLSRCLGGAPIGGDGRGSQHDQRE